MEITTVTWDQKMFRYRMRLAIGALAGFCLALFACAFPALAQNQPSAGAPSQQAPQSSTVPATSAAQAQVGLPAAPAVQADSDQEPTGMIAGSVVDKNGSPVFGATVTLTVAGKSFTQTTSTDEDGQYSFANVPAGAFQVSISAQSFETQSVPGTLVAGEYHALPPVTLVLAPVVTQIVVKPQSVIAQEQLKVQEHQRVLAVFPNFYVTYIPNPAPLDAHQKFQLAWKSTFDPVTFLVVGAGAGLEQVDGQFSGFGPGVQGYAKRYGAAYADVAIGTFLGDAVFPSLLKQDPRFFFKSSGSVKSRILYAIAASVMSKGDNGRWQPNYSNFLGDLSSAGLSNLYYPAQNRNGIALTFENVGINMGARAADYLVQEFLVPKLTFKFPFSHHEQHSAGKPGHF